MIMALVRAKESICCLSSVNFLRTLIFLKWLTVIAIILDLTACVKPPPKNTANVCTIFYEYPQWYWSAKTAEKKWATPISVQMAIIYQESGFHGDAKPPRQHLLWVIPWKRPTSAYGYSQALDGTWLKYEARSGHLGAARDNFGDAADFIAWYGKEIRQQLKLSPSDAYHLYLAYHEGIGGYKKGTYQQKPWLINLAHKVQERSTVFDRQLKQCQNNIKKEAWWYW